MKSYYPKDSKRSLNNRGRLEEVLEQALPDCYRFNTPEEARSLGRGIRGFVDARGRKRMIECWPDSARLRSADQDDCSLRRIGYGFDVLIVWESELKKYRLLLEKLREFHARPYSEATDAP